MSLIFLEIQPKDDLDQPWIVARTRTRRSDKNSLFGFHGRGFAPRNAGPPSWNPSARRLTQSTILLRCLSACKLAAERAEKV